MMSPAEQPSAGSNPKLWWDQRFPELWSLIHFGASARGVYEDELRETAKSVRRRLKRLVESGKDWRTADQVFVQEWLRRQKKRGGFDEEASRLRGLAWEERIAVVGVFVFSWPLFYTAQVLEWSTPTLKQRLPGLLLKTKVDGGNVDARERGRECVRFDLYAGDYLLALMPKQSVGVWKSSDADKHLASCGRCSARLEDLKRALHDLRALEKASWDEKPAWLPVGVQKEESQVSLKSRVFEPMTVWIGRYSLRLALSAMAIALAVWTPSWIRNASWDGFGARWQEWWGESVSQVTKLGNQLLSSSSEVQTEPSVSVVASSEQTGSQQQPATPTVAPPTPVKAPVSASVAPEEGKPVLAKVATQTASPGPSDVESSAWTQNSFFQWGAFTTQDLDQANAQVLAILAEYGATQAGELALGASHRGGKYYHFSVPENVFDALQTKMLQLGMVEFTRTRAISARRTPLDVRRVVFLLRPR